MSYHYINNKFYKAQDINSSYKLFIIDLFYNLINNDKD